MKKTVFYLFNLFIGFVVLFSCGTTNEIEVDPIPQKSFIIKGIAQKMLYQGDGSDSSNCVINYSYFEKGELSYRDSVNQKIKSYITLITQFERKSNVNSKLTDSFFSAQLDSFELIYKSEVEAEIYHLWSLESSIDIDDSHDDFVQLQLSGWSYTGGAHGNGATNTYIIEKSTGKEVLFNDFFSDPTAVTKLAEVYFRKLFELENDADLEEAGFWFENNQFHLNNNFSIVGDKIVFLYNRYEIAPYSGGETVLEISIEEIKSFINSKYLGNL